MNTSDLSRRDLLLVFGLCLLAAEILVYVLLGPLMSGVIALRTSSGGIEQVMGGDLAALLVVVPACLLAAAMVVRGTRGAALIAIAPAGFAVYTYSQIFLGSEFLTQPGNVERFFPLFAAIVITAVVVLARGWAAIPAYDSRVLTSRQTTAIGWTLLATAAFIVVGIHLPSYVDAMRDQPTAAAYLEAPTAFWVVKFYDLVIVAPVAALVGVGLLVRRRWAVKPAVVLLGGFALLGCSVTAMASRMYLVGDPDGSLLLVMASSAVTALIAWSTFAAYRPLVGSRRRLDEALKHADEQRPDLAASRR